VVQGLQGAHHRAEVARIQHHSIESARAASGQARGRGIGRAQSEEARKGSERVAGREQRLKLDTEVPRLAIGQADDQGLDQHLARGHVEGLDQAAQLIEHPPFAHRDQSVRPLVGRDRQGELGVGRRSTGSWQGRRGAPGLLDGYGDFIEDAFLQERIE
jgi:hypothetical protein